MYANRRSLSHPQRSRLRRRDGAQARASLDTRSYPPGMTSTIMVALFLPSSSKVVK